jgi:hypothetical protein
MHMPTEDLTILEVAFKRLTATLLRRLQICLESRDKNLPETSSYCGFIRRISNQPEREASETKMTSKTPTSEYLFLFRGALWHKGLSPEEIQKNLARFTAWFEQLNNQGRFKGGHPLSNEGKIVAGSNPATDGPFAESKEAIAGFFIIQANHLEEAVEIAKGCPGLDYGQTVEVRPLILDNQLLDWKEKLSLG